MTNFPLRTSKQEPIFLDHCFDKNRLKKWIAKIYQEILQTEDLTILDFVETLKNLGFSEATKAGISIGIDDLRIPPKKRGFLRQIEFDIQRNQRDFALNRITALENFQTFIDTWHRTSETLKLEVVANFEATDTLNPVYMMAFSGARGNLSQVTQLVGMRGFMSDPEGQIIDFPIRSNFREGLTLTEYIISCYGARKGLVDTALRTADAGYLTRRLVDVAHQVIVVQGDCKTPHGIWLRAIYENGKVLYPLEKRLVGRVLAEDLAFNYQVENDPDPKVQEKLSRVQIHRVREMSKSTSRFLEDRKYRFPYDSIAWHGSSVGYVLGWKLRPHERPLIGETKLISTSRKNKFNYSKPQFRLPGLYEQPFTKPTSKVSISTGFLFPYFQRNQQLDSARAKVLALCFQKVKVRSPLRCKKTKRVCQLCYGWTLPHAHLAPIGEAVGVLAAQSIGEPGTQLTMRTFHTGGVFSGSLSDETRAPYTGIIHYTQPLKGGMFRAPSGRVAFLAQEPGQLRILKASSPMKSTFPPRGNGNLPREGLALKTEFKLDFPAESTLFFKHQEVVRAGDIFMDFPKQEESGKETISNTYTYYSGRPGLLKFFKARSTPEVKLDLRRHKKVPKVDAFFSQAQIKNNFRHRLELNAGRVYKVEGLQELLPKVGDLVNQNSVFYSRDLITPNSVTFTPQGDTEKTIQMTRPGICFKWLQLSYNLKSGGYTGVLGMGIRFSVDPYVLKLASLKPQTFSSSSTSYSRKEPKQQQITLVRPKKTIFESGRAFLFPPASRTPVPATTPTPTPTPTPALTRPQTAKNFAGTPLPKTPMPSSRGSSQIEELRNQQTEDRTLRRRRPQGIINVPSIFFVAHKNYSHVNYILTQTKQKKKKALPLSARQAKQVNRRIGYLLKAESNTAGTITSIGIEASSGKMNASSTRFPKVGYHWQGFHSQIRTWVKKRTFLDTKKIGKLKGRKVTMESDGLVLRNRFPISSTISRRFKRVLKKNHWVKAAHFICKPGWPYYSKYIPYVGPDTFSLPSRVLNGQSLSFSAQPIYAESFFQSNKSRVFAASSGRRKFSSSRGRASIPSDLPKRKVVLTKSTPKINVTHDHAILLIQQGSEKMFGEFSQRKHPSRSIKKALCSSLNLNAELDIFKRYQYLCLRPTCSYTSYGPHKGKAPASTRAKLSVEKAQKRLFMYSLLGRFNKNVQSSSSLKGIGKGFQQGAVKIRVSLPLSRTRDVFHVQAFHPFIERQSKGWPTLDRFSLTLCRNHYFKKTVSGFYGANPLQSSYFYDLQMSLENQNYLKGHNGDGFAKGVSSKDRHVYWQKGVGPQETTLFKNYILSPYNGEFFLNQAKSTASLGGHPNRSNDRFSKNNHEQYQEKWSLQSESDHLMSHVQPNHSMSHYNALILTNNDSLTVEVPVGDRLCHIGETIPYGREIAPSMGIPTSGRVIYVTKNQMQFQIVERSSISTNATFFGSDMKFVEKNTRLFTQAYPRLQMGDIVQGIPKIEEFFEARQTKQGVAFEGSLDNRLKTRFAFYKERGYPELAAARKSITEIQNYIIESVFKLYNSQGIDLSDKHLEVIVRQMTSKVLVTQYWVGYGGDERISEEPSEWEKRDYPMFHPLPMEFYSFRAIAIRKVRESWKWAGKPEYNKAHRYKHIQFEPVVLGITKAALATDGFISAASFQETTRMLSRAAIFERSDFLKGLKENVIVGHIIPAGTAVRTYSRRPRYKTPTFITLDHHIMSKMMYDCLVSVLKANTDWEEGNLNPENVASSPHHLNPIRRSLTSICWIRYRQIM